MDFIGIVRSLEELLYEVVSWLIFYPRTLWRILIKPDHATRYSEDEQDDVGAERYSDSLSPPLLLMITIGLTHLLEVAIGADVTKGTGALGAALSKSPQNLLIMRAIIFSIIPLVIATLSLKKRGLEVDRQTLRMPFYSQCFLLTPFALMVQGALLANRIPAVGGIAASVLAAAGLAWFLWAQSQWFGRRLALPPLPAFRAAATAVTFALAIALAVAILVALAV
ncbi:MAG: hypothetical protein ACKVOP_14450 [Sphingomonadaceae bacterium]